MHVLRRMLCTRGEKPLLMRKKKEDKGWMFYPSFLLLLTSRSSRSISRNFVSLRFFASGAVFFRCSNSGMKGLRLRNRKLYREHVALFTCVKIDIKCRRLMKEKGEKRGEGIPTFFFLYVRHFTLYVRAHVQGVDREGT